MDEARRYLLVHGSWHGAWCWYKVAPRLRAHGEVVVANLPGRGRDPAHPLLCPMSRLVRAAARSLPVDARTTIVAHSRYGALATALAEAYPERIRRVVYLAAFMLPSGERVADHFARDRDSLIRSHVAIDRLRACDRLDPAIYVEGLYADCDADDIALATGLLCREPSLPALARVRTSDDRFGRLPRAYIRLRRDRAVSPALQDRMIERCPPDRVESIDASHSAYFSRPDQLVETIVRIDGA